MYATIVDSYDWDTVIVLRDDEVYRLASDTEAYDRPSLIVGGLLSGNYEVLFVTSGDDGASRVALTFTIEPVEEQMSSK